MPEQPHSKKPTATKPTAAEPAAAKPTRLAGPASLRPAALVTHLADDRTGTRIGLLAAAWLLGLGGLPLLWHGAPGGGRGSFLLAVLGLVLAVLGGTAGLALAVPRSRRAGVPRKDADSGGDQAAASARTDAAWALAGLATSYLVAFGVVLVLAFDQLARLWNGLGL